MTEPTERAARLEGPEGSIILPEEVEHTTKDVLIDAFLAGDDPRGSLNELLERYPSPEQSVISTLQTCIMLGRRGLHMAEPSRKEKLWGILDEAVQGVGAV